jgi:Xaa-Pro dipeptidase
MRVAEKLGAEDGLIFLPGWQTTFYPNSDRPIPSRQRRYFYYITGCNVNDCHAAYDITNDTLILFIPRNTLRNTIYNGRSLTSTEAEEKYDVDTVLYNDELLNYLQTWPSKNKGQIYVLPTTNSRSLPKEAKARLEQSKLQKAMDEARVIKDDYEVKLIKQANQITTIAHTHILKNIHKFKAESEVYSEFIAICRQQGAPEQAYEPIVASGQNAATLHYNRNDEVFGDRQLMVLDAGCEYDCYASDVTRTIPLSGKWPSQEARQIYNLVQKMQDRCVEKLAPGTKYIELNILAHKIAIEGLLYLGILHNGTQEQILRSGTSLAFLPHGLGHHLGLECHDVSPTPLLGRAAGDGFSTWFKHATNNDPTTPSLIDSSASTLQEGMVVTIEPGL